MYKFSLVIPCYNIELFAERFFNSLKEVNQNVEIIFVDDCSKDDTLNLLRKYVGNKSNMKIVEHYVNKGVSEALNSGIAEISSNWYFRIDPDDVIESGFFKEIFKTIDKHPNAKLIRYKFKFRMDGVDSITKPSLIERIYFKMAFGWSCGINVEKFGIPKFKPNFKMEDFEMFGRQYTKTNDKEIFISKYLVSYTKNRDGSTMNSINKTVLENWREAYSIFDQNIHLRGIRIWLYKWTLRRRIKKWERLLNFNQSS